MAQNRPKGKGWVPTGERVTSGPGRRTSKLPRERGIFGKAEEDIKRTIGSTRGAGRRLLDKLKNTNPKPEAKGPPGPPKPTGKSWVPTGSGGRGLPGMSGSYPGDHRPKKESRTKDDAVKSAKADAPKGATRPPSVGRDTPPTSRLRSTGANSKKPGDKAGPPTGIGRTDDAPKSEAKKDTPTRTAPKNYTPRPELRPGTTIAVAKPPGSPRPIVAAKSTSPNAPRGDGAPKPAEVKKGFFASLFNAREGASTRDEYDRTGFKRRRATSP